MGSPVTPDEPAELQQVSRRTTHEGRRVVQRVTFNRELTPAEFQAWLDDNGWLAYSPSNYGPVTVTVAGDVGIYVHASVAGG